MSNSRIMEKNHPITRANWIWPEAYCYLYNHFAQFRRDLKIARPGKKALLHITADKSYKLYVNGQFVCRGPARGYQSHWPFDTVDLAPYLKAGHNWISVEAYNPGISTFSYLHATRAGLLANVEGKEIEAAWAESQWQHRRSPSHAVDVARLSIQIDFQEHVDAAQDDRAWITSAKAPAGWEPKLFPPHGHQYLGQPFGTPPYATVEERGIPLMREYVRGPVRVIRWAEGTSGDGYASTKNVSWFWADELAKIKAWRPADAVKHSAKPESLTLTIAPTGQGKFRAICIDTGDMVMANLIVEVDGAKRGEIIDFQYDQADAQRNAKTMKPGDGCNAAMSSRLRPRAGKTAHEFYQLIGFQHLTVIARDITRPITLKISMRCAGYPFTFTGKFECSDPLLNQIRQICQTTQQLCSADAYMDTPWREQAQWWGDARVQARNTFYMDGDARLLARGIRSIAGQVSPQGLTYGHAPTSSDWCILPDFALTWILTIWDYYNQTGDISLFVEQWPQVERVLKYFRSEEALGKLGLLQYDRRFWLFEDWSTLPKQHYPAFLNLWYLYTLRHVVLMLREADFRNPAGEYLKLADAHELLILKYFANRKTKLLAPALDEKGRQQGEPSVHDQTLALMANVWYEAHETMVQKILLPFLRDEPVPGAKASAFWCFYTIEQLGLRGYGAEAIAYIRKHWEPMLATGTTWEEFGSITAPYSSNCHAWTSHPAVHFVNILAGVIQDAPAWQSVVFRPTFAAGIDHAEAKVPTPRGMIEASWRKDGAEYHGQIRVPKGVRIKVEVPGKPFRRQIGGVWKF